MGDAEETPWAMVLRLKGEGATFLSVVEALERRGLSRDDIQLLLEGSPELDGWRAGQSAPPPTGQADAQGSRRTADAAPRLRVEVPPSVAVPRAPRGPNVARWVGLVVAAAIAGFGFFISSLAVVHLSLGVVALAVGVAVWFGSRQEALAGIADFVGGGVFESGDVQFAVAVPAGATVGLGESFEVIVTAQNCVAAPRVLVVELGGQTEHVSSPLRREVELPPGAVVEVRVPWRVSSLSSGALGFDVAAFGLGDAPGPRLRSSRGATFITPQRSLATNLVGVATLALIGAGTFVLGDHGSFRVRVDGERPIIHAEPSPQVRVLYAPTPAELSALRG